MGGIKSLESREEALEVVKEWEESGGFVVWDSKLRVLYVDEDGEDYYLSEFFTENCNSVDSKENQKEFCRIALRNCGYLTEDDISACMAGWE